MPAPAAIRTKLTDIFMLLVSDLLFDYTSSGLCFLGNVGGTYRSFHPLPGINVLSGHQLAQQPLMAPWRTCTQSHGRA